MKINSIKKIVKKNKVLFFTYRKLTDQDYRSNFRDFMLNKKNRKPDEVVKKEISLIREFWKCDPMHYYRYRLFEKDLSEEELRDYIPAYYFYNYHMPSVNNDNYIPLTESKIKLNEYFIKKGISTPVVVGIVKNGKIISPGGRYFNFDDLENRMLSSNSDLFFVKPDKGKGGSGIFTVRKAGGNLYADKVLLDGKVFSDLAGHGDYIIQEALSQRDDINMINPSSVNTLRVITQYRDNVYRISAVVLRIGRDGSQVDNSARGGVSVNIDIGSGKFGKYAFTEHSNGMFERHPDTGFVFGDHVLTGWERIKEQILIYAKMADEFQEVAWDIAILHDNICVIEINLNYGIDHLQCCIGGMRRKLNISPLYI